MPPKIRITREDIIQASLRLVRAEGESMLNARSVAGALGCSTQPIFSNFDTMLDLRTAVISASYELYNTFLQKEIERGEYPIYKALGMAYIRFATEERELFKLLFMRDRTGEDLSPTEDFENAVQLIMKSSGVERNTATMMHLECWSCVHGIGVMIATSFLPLESDTVSKILSDVYLGIRSRHLSGGN